MQSHGDDIDATCDGFYAPAARELAPERAKERNAARLLREESREKEESGSALFPERFPGKRGSSRNASRLTLSRSYLTVLKPASMNEVTKRGRTHSRSALHASPRAFYTDLRSGRAAFRRLNAECV